MGKIYSRALHVFIWLGNHESVQDGIQKIISRPSDGKEIDWTPLKPVFTNPLFYQAQAFLVWLGFEGATNMGVLKLKQHQSSQKFDWPSLMPVVQSPWFSRAWCIQELVLASNLIMVTRDSMIPWDKFATIVSRLRVQFNEYRIQTQHPDSQSIENFYFLHDMRERHKRRRKERHDLLELLFLTRGFQATDPRDKLFALVGLAGDVLSSDWEVTPNYNLSVAEVYHRFALWHLTRKRQFGIFSFGRSQNRSPFPELEALPSWVPDLTRPDFAAPLPKLEYLSTKYIDLRYDVLKEFELRKKFFKEAVKVYHADLKYSWWAAGRQSDFQLARIAFSNSTAVIHVVGTKIGSLKVLGTPFVQKNVEESSLMPLKATIEEKNRNLSFLSNDLHMYEWLGEIWRLVGETTLRDKHARLPKNTFNAVWRTMICCMTPGGHNAQFTIFSRAAESMYEKFLARARRLEAKTQDEGGVPTKYMLTNDDIQHADPRVVTFTEDEVKKLLLMHNSVVKWYHGRRFAITDAGDFAAVPESAREGDVVCIFNGSRVPYVLRPSQNGYYTLVGECYVDGMMRGEVRDRFPRRIHETSFSIQ